MCHKHPPLPDVLEEAQNLPRIRKDLPANALAGSTPEATRDDARVRKEDAPASMNQLVTSALLISDAFVCTGHGWNLMRATQK